MTTTNPRVTRTPTGLYIVTVPGCNAPDSHLLVDGTGRVMDLSGAAVSSGDVAIVQGELKSVGASGLADLVLAWWRSRR